MTTRGGARRRLDARLCAAARHSGRVHRPRRRPAAALEAASDSAGALEPDEIAQRFAAADRRVRNRGMSYRVQGETAERVWPLGRMPLLISEAEWREIERGVAQRAELIERVLADVYGEGRLIAEGALPAAALTGSHDFVAADARRDAAGRALAPALRRRHRPRARRALVGARRPRPGAFRLRLRAGEPARRLAGVSQPLRAR